MRNGLLQVLITAGVAAGAGRASASIIVDQPPTYLGGYHSDTEFLDSFGNPGWQRIADNIRLNQSAVVRRVAWFGFYGGEDQSHVPPTGTETMRVRFYGPRADGLPDDLNILFEEIFTNLPRTPTGRTIAVQGRPLEFRYESDLDGEFSLFANATYWLEIVQIGDPNSTFRWETGFGSVPSFAYSGHLTMGEWLTTGGSMAFQLSSIPEPSTGLLSLCLLGFALARRARRRMPGG